MASPLLFAICFFCHFVLLQLEHKMFCFVHVLRLNQGKYMTMTDQPHHGILATTVTLRPDSLPDEPKSDKLNHTKAFLSDLKACAPVIFTMLDPKLCRVCAPKFPVNIVNYTIPVMQCCQAKKIWNMYAKTHIRIW